MNLYLCILAIVATVIVTLSLVVLIPNGMWLYLIALIFGVVTLTYTVLALWFTA